MKKLVAGAVTAAALTFGGVTAVGVSAASASPYVVQPTSTVTTAHAGSSFTFKFNSGVVGAPANGKVTWTFVKAPKGVKKNKHKVHNKVVKDGSVKVNLKGKAFPKPGKYKIKFTSGGKSYVVTVKVK